MVKRVKPEKTHLYFFCKKWFRPLTLVEGGMYQYLHGLPLSEEMAVVSIPFAMEEIMAVEGLYAKFGRRS